MVNHLAPLAVFLVHLDTLRNPFLVKLNVAGLVSNVVLSRLVTGRPAWPVLQVRNLTSCDSPANDFA